LGETRVDLVHLLEDLRDAYPHALEETILTEIVANALDSGARSLRFETDAEAAELLAVDDGAGMTKAALTRYHDLASTGKRRGKGIGFAGVGIKLGLLACAEVVTETRRGRQHSATSWRLSKRTRAPWSWIEPPHFLEADGTAVLLRLSNPLSQLLDGGFLEATVLRHFQPLFEPEFLDLLAGPYPDGFSIVIDGSVIVGPIRPAARQPLSIRVGRQRKPSGVGYLARHDEPLPEPERGLAISTLGKVIRRGWDWLGVTPAEPDRIEGLVEVPALAEGLTLNKGDFLRHGQSGALFVSYRKAIQEAVTAQLAAWGTAPPPRRKTARTRPIERDLRKVLGDLAEEYPVLATLAERRSGGQRRLPLGEPGKPGAAGAAGEWSGVGGLVTARPDVEASEEPEGDAGSGGGEAASPDGESSERPAAAPTAVSASLPGPARRKRPTTLSLEVRFESLPGELALGRLVESTVWVNEAHPAYRRAVASRAEAYHIALTVASALAPLTVEPAHAQSFIHRFLAGWGEAGVGKGKG
jgi:hypothetical protein